MEDAIAMAKAHGKPLALSETGAGGNGTTTGPVDDPEFPKWLASELTKAQSQGVAIDHVNIWDAQLGDGNWDFSSASAAKPLEAAAWAKYFGASSDSRTAWFRICPFWVTRGARKPPACEGRVSVGRVSCVGGDEPPPVKLAGAEAVPGPTG